MKNTLLILFTFLLLSFSGYAQEFTATNKYNNIVRIGIDNHLVIKVPGVYFMDIVVTTDNGSFAPQYSDSNFIYNPVNEGEATIHIAIKTRGGIKKIGDAIFHVKKLPPLDVTLCRRKQGNISKAVLMNCPGPTTLRVEEYGVPVGIITSFDLKLIHNNVVTHETTIKLPPGELRIKFDAVSRMIFKTLKTGDVVSIANVKFEGPWCRRASPGITYTVVE